MQSFTFKNLFQTFFAVFVFAAVLFSVGSIFETAEAQSSFTKQINYQGKITPAGTSTPVADASYDVTFKLYTQATGGTAIWTETWDASTSQITTSNGLFSVLLGEYTSLDSLNFNQTLYLGVNFDNDGEMTPRKELGAVPAAFEADRLDGLDSAQFLRSDTPDTLTSSSSDTALTVDQQGSGNALEVTSSSTSYLLVDNSGNVGVGDATPDQKFTVGPNSEFQVNDTGAITGITGLSGATGTYDFSGATLNVSTSTIDDVDEIDPSLRSGADTTLITGTPGAAGDCAQFNEDGDLVSFGGGCDTDGGTSTPVTPGGTDGQIQYNDNGSFGGASAFTFDDLTGNIGIGTATATDRLTLTDGDFEQTITSDPVQVGSVSTNDLEGAQSVVVSDSYAYVASFTVDSFTVIDISDPESPTQVGTISNTDLDGAYHVSVSGSYAYVAGRNADTLVIIDISDPTNPTQVSTLSNATLATPLSVNTSGSYAYVTNRDTNSLAVIDISDPTNPIQVGTVSSADLGSPRSTSISGSYAYVASSDSDSLAVIDISDPTNPIQVGTVSSADLDSARFVDTSGSYAYVAGRDADALTIIDISDPGNPTQVGTISSVDLDDAYSVSVAGSYAYVASRTADSLTIIDISDPANPTQVGTISDSTDDFNGAYSVTTAGSYAYVASSGSNSLTVFRLPGTRVPTLEAGTAEISQLSVSQDTSISGSLSVNSGLSVGGSILSQNDLSATGSGSIGESLKVGYSATTTNQTTVTDPSPFATLSLTGGDFEQTIASDPVQVGFASSTDTENAFSVTTAGSYAYVASTVADSLTVLDISDPTNPTQVGAISNTDLDNAQSVTVAGSYAYVASSQADSLTIIDISDPTNPTQTGTISNPNLDSARTVTVSGSYAYVASLSADSLTIIDISNPANPTQVGVISNADLDFTRAVSVSGSYAYVAGSFPGSLTTIDISDPSNPIQVGTATSTDLDGARSVTTSDSYAYVASRDTNSLVVLDITDPATPTQVGTASTTALDGARSVTVSGSYAYVASSNADSVTIIDISDPTSPTQVGTVSNANLDGATSVSVAGSYAYVASQVTDSLTVFRLPGTRVPTLEAGTAKISQLGISQNADVSGFLSVGTGLSVGGSIFSQNGLGITGTSSFRSSVNIGTSTTIFSENTNIPSRSLVIGNGTLCVDDGGENCNDAARNPGTIYANNVNVQSVDLAEQYPTLDEDLEPGDIVMLDPKNPVFIERFDYEGSDTPEADQATLEAGSEATTTDMNFRDERDEDESSATSTGVFSPRLLGVVSTKPGFLLGGFADEDFETRDATGTAPALRKVPLALSGRVPVKVSTANGAIEAGDRIAPSSQPGVGMKAFPDSPQTLGIALESFTDDTDDETATIIVFIDNDYRTLSDTLTRGTGLTGNTLASLRGATDTWSLSEDGELVVEELRVRGRARFGSSDNPTGITLFDERNGESYCLQVSGGALENANGECGVQSTSGVSTSPAEDDSDNTVTVPAGGGDGGNTSDDETPENNESTSTSTATSTEEDTSSASSTPATDQENEEETAEEEEATTTEEETKESENTGEPSSEESDDSAENEGEPASETESQPESDPEPATTEETPESDSQESSDAEGSEQESTPSDTGSSTPE